MRDGKEYGESVEVSKGDDGIAPLTGDAKGEKFLGTLPSRRR